MRRGEPTARMWRKAARLLYQQRVRIVAHGPSGCLAEVQGDTGTYTVELWPGQETCECIFAQFHARRRCTHILAVLMAWRAFYPKEREGEGDGSSQVRSADAHHAGVRA